ncbi:MAG: hypothetical protein J7555_01230 [Chloroflexi bacterium]|nr:hypothetical protein [Chloroflexota bacterium]
MSTWYYLWQVARYSIVVIARAFFARSNLLVTGRLLASASEGMASAAIAASQ